MATPFFFKTGIEPVRKVICGRHEGPLKQAADDFGWEEHSTDWRETVRRDDIDVVSIVTPPASHAEMAVEAARAGKHIFCEKPFTVAEAEAEQLSTMLTAQAGSARMEPVDVDDTTLFLARFEGDAVGTFEATRFASGRRNHNRIEVNGSKGLAVFDLEEMNRLEYYNAEDPDDVPRFRSIQVNEGCHPYVDHWWPPGHGIGYQNTFVNQYADFFQAITDDTKPTPGFEEGLGNQKVLEAVTRSIEGDGWVAIS